MKRKNIIIGTSLSVILFLLSSSLITAYLFQQERLSLHKSFNNFTTVLIDNFNINEKIADSVSIRYLRMKNQHIPLPSSHYDSHYHLYGVNTDHNTCNSSILGTFESISPPNEQQVKLATSIDYIFERYKFDDPYSQRRHYFYSINDDFFYSKEKLPLNQYKYNPDVFHANVFFGEMPDYIDRKFISDTTKKGTTSTEFYKDAVTKKCTYSVISYVYDLSKPNSAKVVGALTYDYNIDDLRAILTRTLKDNKSKYISAKLTSSDTKRSVFFVGNQDYSFKIGSFPLSKKYTVHASISLRHFILEKTKQYILINALSSILIGIITYIFMNNNTNENMCDSLTSVYNRKLLRHIKLNKDHEKTIAVFDCNKFKKINDTYGHDMGDKALIFISETLKKNTRKNSDYIIRLGGDEFCIIFNKLALPIAEKIMQRINRTLATFSEDFILSVSYGVTLSQASEDINDAIHRADKQLYTQKQARSR
ncbi:diguanylate cyclase domain-containing protein [Cedecea sp. NFIX57]|uniref:diguanylate cyclase domain-containing protein n=1 Tax=Cedecea sp. NFIX57 TaxID=1566286 RepID=UPI000A0B7550|nr:diguanylate cyclase [Cedecea sp. NFIX57]SMG57932.1 diguanylate cyclase (GGDEF) domain-containing protein [Cedecea sp. NFIX57]